MLDTDKTGSAPSPAARSIAAAGIRHGYFTRVGGVSDGIYAGLNIGTGSDDDQAMVRENRRRVAAWMGVPPERLLTAHQVHSPDVDRRHASPSPASARRPTRIVTDTPGHRHRRLDGRLRSGAVRRCRGRASIGAAHAGWKGAFTGVLENTDRRHGAPRRQPRAHRRRARPFDRPATTTRSGRNSSSASSPPMPATTRYFAPSGNAGPRHVRPQPLHRRPAGRRPAWRPRCSTAAPMPRRSCSFPTGAPRTARKPDYGRQISAIVLEND